MADMSRWVRTPYSCVMTDAEGRPRAVRAESYLTVEPTTDPNRMRVLRIGRTQVRIELYIHPSLLEDII